MWELRLKVESWVPLEEMAKWWNEVVDAQGRFLLQLLRAKPMRVIQYCQANKTAQNKLQTKYANKSTVTDVSALNNLFYSKVTSRAHMEHHMLTLKCSLPGLR